MLLAVNVGNTNIVFGIHDGERWLRHWRVRTVRDKMPDEYGVLFRDFLREAGVALGALDQVAISSVVPPITDRMEEMLVAQTGVAPLVISTAVKTGLTFAIDNPAELGADLVADGVAAYDRVRDACIVVDFGTATTFSAVAADATFLGVAIAPGINMAMSALAGGTAQLPQIRLSAPPRPIGTNTVHSIQSGIVLGYVGMVESLIARFRKQMGVEAQALATGGLARLIAPLTSCFAVADEWLTLDGIRLIALMNKNERIGE
ncbi:MAG TPA: type III pantothenate kinase [Anaerolineae bacterium]|nr:type III pantothenate kinase [Anaerolineae bacterium]HQI83299.1 type III pantothenate kinase [Anaerolineae bacterium]